MNLQDKSKAVVIYINSCNWKNKNFVQEAYTFGRMDSLIFLTNSSIEGAHMTHTRFP